MSLSAAVASVAPAARIVAEWDPGIREADLGGALVVDSYGVDGLGAHQVRLDDGTTALAVCIQADVGHSLAAEYSVDDTISLAPELGYLLWAYLRPGSAPTDEQAAAVNVLAWRYTDARRRDGAAVWQGDELEIRVLGVGRLTGIEQATVALHAEATARRGPWVLDEVAVRAGTATVRVSGPGGSIAAVPVRFVDDAGRSATSVTDADGVASIDVVDGVTTIDVSVDAPGDALALVAPGSQRLAIPTPSRIVTTVVTVPTTTTTTTTTTMLSATTTTAAPATTLSTTSTVSIPATTTSTTTTVAAVAPPARPTTLPPTSTSTTVPVTSTTQRRGPPPTLPPTGAGSRDIGRVAAILFTLGTVAVFVATPRQHVSDE